MKQRLLLDTNVLLDYLLVRKEYAQTRKVILFGALKEFRLYASSAQANDILYFLGGKEKHGLSDSARRSLLNLCKIVEFVPLGKNEFITAIESGWEDTEDACVLQVAKAVNAHAIITRNVDDFAKSSIPAYTPTDFFEKLKEEGYDYDEVEF